MTSIVHCKRAPYDVYIGRPSIWGNPWQVGPDGTREEVIERYETWLRTGRDFGHPGATEAARESILSQLASLEDKTLGCWCAPLACHGTVLVKLLGELS